MNDSQTSTYDRLINKFDSDIILVIDNERNNDNIRLRESGQLRILLRKTINDILHTSSLQLDILYQVKLYTYICEYLKNVNEYILAIEYYNNCIIICDKIDDIIIRTINKVQMIHGLAQCTYNDIIELRQYAIAPMAVSKILKCLQQLRLSLDLLFEMTIRKQEEYSWLILNSCKLIYSIGQPLVWYNCGKYISEITFFAAMCMESVINLSTIRHIKFRMKLYSSIFYSSLSHGVNDEAKTILDRAIKEVKMLREKEELDPPIPIKIETPIINAEIDLAIMRCVLSYWLDPSSFSLSDSYLSKFEFPTLEVIEKAEKFNYKNSSYITRSIADRCMCECARIQQLTSGNTNEVWRKRSTSLLKAFWTLFENIGPDSYFHPKKDEEIEEGVEILTESLPILYPIITIDGLVEITTIAMFDSTEGLPIKELLNKIWAIVDASPTQLIDYFQGENDLLLLRKLACLIDAESDNDRLSASIDLAQNINYILHNDHGSRRIALNRRISIGIWSKYIYPGLQKILSNTEDSDSLTSMSQLLPSLLIVARVLDITLIEDSLLYGSIIIMTAIIMNFLNENRASIALLRQAIDTIEEHRACRVDIQLHMPDDSRDVFSIQRLSFTTKSDAQDWYHSMKRLGAHAFAGFGIFGAGSSADRSDQAVAELHADLLSLLFRYELTYSLQQSATKKLKGKQFGKTLKLEDTKKGTSIIGSETTVGGTSSFFKEATVIIQQLKSYCAKNNYAKCILYLEMAKLETNEDSITNLLKDAKSCIEECEASEEMLKNGFENLSVVSENEQKPPIILARTHRYIYMAPVHCRKLKKAVYYRPLAKEQGSGTNISLSSNGLGGCEQRIMVSNMVTPTSCAIKISPLRTGETYVFGYAAFTDDEKLVGTVSPTSLPIQAVNPIPTILLWSFLARTSDTVNALSARRFASNKVCESFFLNPPEPDPRSIGKGENLFISKEPILCMLALQQASPVLLFEFVRSFLLLEAKWAVRVPQKVLHWNLRKDSQIEFITSLRRTAVIACVAAYIGSHELIVQTVTMGFNIALNLLEFDDIHLSYIVQHSLVTFLASLQTIPKRNWLELEYRLYTRLYNHILKLSLLTHNVQPVVNLVSVLLPEILDSEEGPKLKLNSDIESEFYSFLSITSLGAGIARTDEAVNQIKSLLTMQMSPENTREFFWQLSSAKRAYSLKSKATSLVNIDETPSPDLMPIDQIMKDKPMTMSAYLVTLVNLAKDLISTGQSGNVSKLLARYPVYEEYLTPATKQLLATYNLLFVKKLPTAEELAALAAAAAPVKGKAAPAPAPAVVETTKNEEDKFKVYEEVSTEEESEQIFALAQLTALFASVGCSIVGTKNYFPESLGGPLSIIDPYLAASAIDIPESEASSDEVAAPVPVSPRAKLSNLSRTDFVNFNAAAITMFTRANTPASAVKIVVRLWNFIVDEWIDPQAFAIEFKDIKSNVCKSCFSLTEMFESMVGVHGDDDNSFVGGFGETFGMSIEGSLQQSIEQSNTIQNNDNIVQESKFNLSVREINEKLYGCRDFFVFMIEVFWLQKEYADVVALGSRILTAFMEMSEELSKRLGDVCLPLMIHAQEQLIDRSTNKMNDLQAALDKFVFDFQEYLKKKNRKKLRIARVEKDPEELAFDAEKAVYQSKVDDAALELRNNKNRLIVLNLQQKKFKTLYSTGVQLLDKVREACRNFLLECQQQIEKNNDGFDEKKDQSNDYRGSLTSHEMEDKCEGVLDQYVQVGNFLREKKDKIALIQCLKEQADLLLLFGRVDEARSLWLDAIDGLFNTMDACKNWKNVTEKALTSLDSTMLSTFLPASVILGKLSKYCSTSDLDSKAGYCRMAAELIRALFFESVGHPVTTVGFAAYTCYDLCGYAPFGIDYDKIAALGVANSLEEIISVLLADGHRISALPVVVFLEHYHGYYTRNPSKWLSARLIRIRILIDQHLYAEAAAMMASIKYTITTIADNSYLEPVNSKNTINDVSTFDTRTNDLNFYSYAPFFNHLDPSDDKNKQALAWIAVFANDFKDFSASYTIRLPTPKLSPEEQAAEDARLAAEAAKAAEEAKKNKGKKPAEEAPKEQNTNMLPLFDSLQQANVMTECAHFLISISSVDVKLSNPAKDTLKLFGDQGNELLTKTIEILGSTAKSLSDSFWIDLYGQVMLLRVHYYISRRNLKDARTVAMSLIQILRNENITLNMTSKIRSTVTQIWLKVKYYLLDIAEKQSRHNDALAIANASSKEASIIMAGYWLRAFLLRRALINFKLGNLDDSDVDCDAIIRLYESNLCYDLSLVRCYSLKASIYRERSLNGPKALAVKALVDGLKFSRIARDLAESLANQSGFIGPDSNITYDHENSAVIQHELLPSHLFNLTNIHTNIPDVTIKPKIDPKVFSLVSGEITIGKKITIEVDDYDKRIGIDLKGLRLGPIDSSNKYTSSVFANIYLEEVRVLVVCDTGLCLLLDEARCSGAAVPYNGDSSDDDPNFIDIDEVLKEEILIGESALKTLRHCIYSPSYARISLLLLVAKTRVITTKNNPDIFFTALYAALQASVDSAHPWEIMKSICVQLIEVYGDNSIELGVESRLLKAVTYLLTAIKISKQYRTLLNNSITLGVDNAFTNVPEEVTNLLLAFTSSSASKSLEAAAPVAVDPKAKGKAPATTAGTDAGPNGRDALEMLISFLRESDPLWLDSYELDMTIDLHILLKKTYAIYAAQCSLAIIPDPDSTPTVMGGSISTLYTIIKTPTNFIHPSGKIADVGLYSHVTAYYLLGSKAIEVTNDTITKGSKSAPSSSSSVPIPTVAEPILTKIIIYRPDIIIIEKALRDTRDRLIDGINKKINNIINNIATSLCPLLVSLVGLLKNGLILEDAGIKKVNNNNDNNDDNDEKFHDNCPETSASVVVDDNNKIIIIIIIGGISCKLPVDEVTLLRLSDVITFNKDSDNIIDNNILSFMRIVLGYPDE